MDHTDRHGPDRDTGAMLSGEDVERLRSAIGWLRSERGLKLKDIALGCDASEHTVRNFAYRKSIRPDNSFLGKLYKYVDALETLLPEGFLLKDSADTSRRRGDSLGRLGRLDLVRMDLPITEDDLKRVFDRFSGYYLCFRQSSRPDMVAVSWLHIMPLNPKLDVAKEGLPLPKFTLFIEYPDPVDPQAARGYIIGGYVTRRNGHIYLIGQNDGNLKNFVLKEPPNRRLSYLQGLSLQTSAEDGELFAARVLCQYLGKKASRENWSGKIGVFTFSAFHELFDNADIVKRAIGNDGVLTGMTAG